ncbi:hypothetical protein BDV93DRAFT_528976 [Ceratobasidium sp. AG-I]|nr:hypothetical protein BDV93DRAFT_528976 [Ceratobasidium sp. AG-I]
MAQSLIGASVFKTCVLFMKDVRLYRAEFRSWLISTATCHLVIPGLDSLRPQLLLLLLFITCILRVILEQQEIWGKSDLTNHASLSSFPPGYLGAFTRRRSSTRRSAGFPDLSFLNVRRLPYLLARSDDSPDGA